MQEYFRKNPVPEIPATVPEFAGNLKKISPFVIAEIKKASPSKGIIRNDFDPVKIAGVYQELGAAAISVLTDRDFFSGSPEHLKQVKNSVMLPVLRKDFILSKEQILESKLYGADAILLIVRILTKEKFRELWEYAREVNLDVLVEIHSERELEMIAGYPVKILGINHRDLDTLAMDYNLSFRLAPVIKKEMPETLIVAESGIEDPELLKDLTSIVDGFLIGTYFMQSEDIRQAWKNLFSGIKFRMSANLSSS